MLAFLLLAAAAAPDGKTMAMDDWHTMEIVKVAVQPPNHSPSYLEVHAGDLDGDGLPDDAYLRLACVDGKLQQASYDVKSPRDIATGQASGKRQHGSITIVKEWGAASPQLSKIKPQYDIKTLKGNERMADGWTAITLNNSDGLCGATQAAAAVAIVKSKSNITNN
jgi:hypothetical protein